MVNNILNSQFGGFSSATVVDRQTGQFRYIYTVVGSAEMNLAIEKEETLAGEYRFPVGTLYTKAESSLSLTLKQVSPSFFEDITGATVEEYAASTGNIIQLTNHAGTSVIDPLTGITAVNIVLGEEANLKSGNVTLVADSANSVNIYYSDSAGGADLINTEGRINQDPLVIAGGTDNAILDRYGNATLGLSLTGAVSVGFQPGDTATFSVIANHSGAYVATIEESILPGEFGLILRSGTMSDGSYAVVELYRVSGAMPGIAMAMDELSEFTLDMSVLSDACRGGQIGNIRIVNGGASSCPVGLTSL